jgi:TIR domain
MADIFLSYAREDEARARSLAADLERRGWSVFWDRRIPHGRNFRLHIQQQLDSARCIVVLWSKASLGSQFVLDEAAEGLNDGRLLPALIEPVNQPLGFRGLQAAKLTDWHGTKTPHDEFERLVVSIAEIVPPSVQPPGASSLSTGTVAKSTDQPPEVTPAARATELRDVDADREDDPPRRGVDYRPLPPAAQARADGEALPHLGLRDLFLHPVRGVLAVIILLTLMSIGVWWWLSRPRGAVFEDANSPRVNVDRNLPGAIQSPSKDATSEAPFEPILSTRVPRSAVELGLRKKVRPIQPGTSVGTIDVTGTGTICCIVASLNGANFVLSDLATFHGTVVVQPGAMDQGREADQIGTIGPKERRFQLESGVPYKAFAGIARLLPAIPVSSQIPGLGRMGDLAKDIKPGETVRMVGRTSGLVQGTVTAVNVSEEIAGYSGLPVTVDGLIRVTALSQPGDAGAPVLTMNNELLGMVVGGSKASTVVMPLRDLLEGWKLKLIR